MVSRSARRLGAGFVSIVFLLAFGTATAAPFKGEIVKSVGTVRVVSGDGRPVDLSATGNVVRETQTISTGADGRAVISFNNGTITVLDPNSRLQVKTPNWFVHAAGKAFFAFKKLFGGAEERKVQNTVALIGIRGTTFVSYENEQTAIALDEGELNLQTLGDVFTVVENGDESKLAEFTLNSEQQVTFDGSRADVGALSAEALADIAAFTAFAGSLIGDFSVDFNPADAAGAAAGAAAVAAADTDEEEPQATDEKAKDEQKSKAASSAKKWYVGVGYGVSKSETDADKLADELNPPHNISAGDISLDNESNAAKLFGGYWFNRYLGVELGYTDLGEFTSEIVVPSGSNPQDFADDVAEFHPISAKGVYATANLRFNIVFLTLYGRAGVYAWEGEVKAASASTGVTSDATRDGTDPVVALGVEFSFNPIGIRLEAERYELDGEEVQVYSGNLLLRF